MESSGGSPGDWVELYNAGPSAVDLSGWSFVDNDDTHVRYALPAGTSIPAGGFLLLEEAAFGFGLGAGDTARLFDSVGSLVDSYTWTSHATTTYGRCPDGTGGFLTTTAVTKSAANDCSSPVTVLINEVESSGGVPGDWVELYNAGTGAVDVSGWSFLDNDDTHVRYVLPTLSIFGVALIVLPHIIGAPQPETHESPVPDGLHHQFVVAVTVTNLIFWVALGGIVGLVRQRFLGQSENLGKSFA